MMIEYIPKNFCGKNFQKIIHNGGLNCENSFFGGFKGKFKWFYLVFSTLYTHNPPLINVLTVDLYHINTPMRFGYEKFTFLNHFLTFFDKM